VTVLLSAALRATFMVGTAWIATQALRWAGADVRRRIWLGTLWAIAALPVVIWLASRTAPAALRLEMPPSITGWAALPARPGVSGLTVAWTVGTLIVFGRLVAGLLTIGRITRAARLANNEVVSAAHEVAYSDDILTPVTWGVAHPIVLLPGYARDWPDERQGLLIRHERAHIEHHDWPWQMVAQAVCAVFWFHPLVWLAAAGLARESERAADDRVLAQGADAQAYAAELLAIARVVQRAGWSAAVAMVGRSSLERRVRDILDRTRPHGPATRTARIAVVTALAIGAVALSVPLAALQGAQVYKVGDEGVTPPVPVSKTKVSYTAEAMRQRCCRSPENA
jgi:hypothetical protein